MSRPIGLDLGNDEAEDFSFRFSNPGNGIRLIQVEPELGARIGYVRLVTNLVDFVEAREVFRR